MLSRSKTNPKHRVNVFTDSDSDLIELGAMELDRKGRTHINISHHVYPKCVGVSTDLESDLIETGRKMRSHEASTHIKTNSVGVQSSGEMLKLVQGYSTCTIGALGTSWRMQRRRPREKAIGDVSTDIQ